MVHVRTCYVLLLEGTRVGDHCCRFVEGNIDRSTDDDIMWGRQLIGFGPLKCVALAIMVHGRYTRGLVALRNVPTGIIS